MRSVSLCLLLMAAALFSNLGATTYAAPPAVKNAAVAPTGIKWQTTLQAAHKQAVLENKPIMIVFGAEWCGYCKKLEKQTLNTPEMTSYINENFVPLHLDLDKEKKIGQILEVESLPCTVVLSPNADLLGRINGYMTPVPYQKNLVAAKELHRPVQAIVPTQGTAR